MTSFEVSVELPDGRERAFRVRANSKLEAIDKLHARQPRLADYGCSVRRRMGFKVVNRDEILEVEPQELTALVRPSRRRKTDDRDRIRNGRRS